MKKKIIIVTTIIFLLVIIGVLFCINKQNKINDYKVEKIEYWNYFCLYQNEKMGVIDNKGNIIVNPEYNSIQIPNPTKPVFICEKDDSKIVLNEKSEIIFNEYDEVTDIPLNELAIEVPYEKSVLKFKKNNKYGLINFEGKIVVKAEYDSLENLPYKEGEFLVKKNDKYGVINMIGKTVIDTKYDEIKIDSYYEEENDYKYSGYIVGIRNDVGTVYNYINYKGEELGNEYYQNIERIIDIQNKDEIYLKYEKNDKYGILKNSQEIIKNEYDNIQYDDFNEIYILLKNNQYTVVDHEGKEILNDEYDNINIEGIYIYATKNDEQFLFDNKGQQLDDIQYKSEYWTDNSEYKIVIDKQNKYGVENASGYKLIDNNYYYLEYLGNNYFIVSGQNGKNGIIDTEENEIINIEYDVVQKIEDTELIQVYNITSKRLEIYNTKMKKIAEMENGNIFINKDYIKLYSNEQIKYFDLQGNEKQSKEILNNNKIFADVKNGKWGFIDKEGKVIVPYKYDYVTEFNEYGFAGIKIDNKWGSIDENGNIIIEPIYEFENNENDINFIGKYYKFIYGYKKFYYTSNIN